MDHDWINEWLPEPKRYLISSKIFYENGKTSYFSQLVKLGEAFSHTIGTDFLKNIEKIETKFDEIEPLKLKPSFDRLTEKPEIIQLNLGIRNSNDISYIGTEYFTGTKPGNFERFFFNYNHQPAGFEARGYGRPGWPELNSPFITEGMKIYFNNLKKIRPKISNNLDHCISLLEQHYKTPIKTIQ